MFRWSSRRSRRARPRFRLTILAIVTVALSTLFAAAAGARDVAVVVQAVLRERPEPLARVVTSFRPAARCSCVR